MHISAAVENAHWFMELLDRFALDRIKDIPFDALCSCLRLVGPRWELSWILAQVLYIHHVCVSHGTPAADLVVHHFSELRDKIFLYHLDRLWTTKPILNGNDVISIFSFSKGNSDVQRLLCELVVWQIKHSSMGSGAAATKEQAVDVLKDIYSRQACKFKSKAYPIKEF